MTRPDSFRAYSASLVICIYARFVVFSCVYFGLLLPLFFSFCSLTRGQSRGYNLKNIPKTQMLQNSVYIIWDPITMTSREHTSKKPSKHLITDPMAPLWGELTGGRWIPLTKGQSWRKQFHVMTSACTVPCQWSLVSWWWHRMAVELLWIRSLWWCNVLATVGRRYTMMTCTWCDTWWLDHPGPWHTHYHAHSLHIHGRWNVLRSLSSPMDEQYLKPSMHNLKDIEKAQS